MPSAQTAAMVFERHEKKYLLTPIQYNRLLPQLLEHMRQDQYGLHTIGSLYYDTENSQFIRRSLDKPDYKEKLRLRSYGIPTPDDTVYIELKKKLDGVTYKRRVAMTHREAGQYLHGGLPPQQVGQILGEIDWVMQRYRPVPKVLMYYDRIALYGIADNGLRITFDTNIRWRDTQLSLTQGDFGTQLLAPGQRLMEIKLPGAFPYWLSQLLAGHRLYPASFSKYGAVYEQNLCKEENRHVG